MVVLIGWMLILVGVIVALERNSKRLFYEFCKMECSNEMPRLVLNQPDRYML